MSIATAVRLLRNARHAVAFTGAGISVESGIPAFRGADGLWSRYDPRCLDIGYFLAKPVDAWRVIREIFYDYFGQAHPNDAHRGLATLESAGLLRCVITQNIDSLHQAAGSIHVHEFHGCSRTLCCLRCSARITAEPGLLRSLPPRCSCGGVLKPDFVFFGEEIPDDVRDASFRAAEKADVMLVIGSTGEVQPACLLPYEAKRRGAMIIEINPEPSLFTPEVTDVYLRGPATVVMRELLRGLAPGLPQV